MATLNGFITYRLQVHVGQQRKVKLLFPFNSKKRKANEPRDHVIHPQSILFLNVPLLCLTAVAQWLRCRVTNRKVAGSISAGVIGNFH